VAEDIELEAQSNWLERTGADELQGYLFSKPVSPDEIEPLLRLVGILEAGPNVVPGATF
jgi:EAL domain-containing protein (putative c-di-GMP-specific phosphodiesterase class I)